MYKPTLLLAFLMDTR